MENARTAVRIIGKSPRFQFGGVKKEGAIHGFNRKRLGGGGAKKKEVENTRGSAGSVGRSNVVKEQGET